MRPPFTRFLFPEAVVLFLWVAAASAQPQPQVHRRFGAAGTVELGGSGTFTAVQPVVAGNTGTWVYDLAFMPYAGYFLAEGFELGINPAGVSVTTIGDTSTVRLRILVAPSYNFHTPTMITPFVEGLAGFTSSSLIRGGSTTSVAGFTFGGRLGIKTAVTERGLLTIGVQYLRITLNASGAPSRSGSNELAIAAGYTVWLN
ncbi:MAG TPA: hypothetical protein VML00_05465 [Bacteroidota bacterium]|nr:hypothetical protein [Bacteroidota bacterium]